MAQEAGLGLRINTVLQTCFFALADILPRDQAITEIKHAIEETYGKRGEAVLRRNFAAVDGALAALHEVPVPATAAGKRHRRPPVPDDAPEFVKRITALMLAGKGDLLPVSALPIDGTFPTGTARFEKRSIAVEIPIWDQEICIECGLCAMVCPHTAIRSKVFPLSALDGAPAGFASKLWSGKDHPDHRLTIQVAPDDCTGCGVCVDVCPAFRKEAVRHKAINMEAKSEVHLARERANFAFFLTVPEIDRTSVKIDTVKGSQLLQPLFEFSGACAGCGETPYLKLLSQLVGDRALIANATGCSSIYGGNLPTTPWAKNHRGTRTGLGELALRGQCRVRPGHASGRRPAGPPRPHPARSAGPRVGVELAAALLEDPQETEEQIQEQRRRVTTLKERLARARCARGALAPGGGRRPGPAERLDRRRRRLGL